MSRSYRLPLPALTRPQENLQTTSRTLQTRPLTFAEGDSRRGPLAPAPDLFITAATTLADRATQAGASLDLAALPNRTIYFDHHDVPCDFPATTSSECPLRTKRTERAAGVPIADGLRADPTHIGAASEESRVARGVHLDTLHGTAPTRLWPFPPGAFRVGAALGPTVHSSSATGWADLAPTIAGGAEGNHHDAQAQELQRVADARRTEGGSW